MTSVVPLIFNLEKELCALWIYPFDDSVTLFESQMRPLLFILAFWGDSVGVSRKHKEVNISGVVLFHSSLG